MRRGVNPRIYAPMTQNQVIGMLRADEMPSPFTRRMRVLNLLSASVLQKIEDHLFSPWDVMKIHHMLDEQISQDAIIDTIENDALGYALATGNLGPLWDVAPAEPKLLAAFHGGWIQRFFRTPFDPICVMLAMRTKLLLDIIDELGHSYNLIRKLGYGFIDFGEVPGEEPGDPGDYYDPVIDNPIDDPDGPVNGSDSPGGDDYTPPGPGDPGYTEPVPLPGDPGYVEPAAGEGLSGGGLPGGGGSAGYGSGAYHVAPERFGIGRVAPVGAQNVPPTGDPCADVDDPEQTVSFSYTTQGMAVDETQEFSVTGNHPRWSYEAYEWKISGGGGSLTRSGADPPDPIYGPEEDDYDPEAVMRGFDVTYTAPPANAECAKNPTIELWCGGELMVSLDIAVNDPSGNLAIEHFGPNPLIVPSCKWDGYGWVQYAVRTLTYCDGEIYTAGESAGGSGYTCESAQQYILEIYAICPGIEWDENCDARSEAALASGCCPEEWL